VLVADDDETSCCFLADGLRSLGANVTVCNDGVSALALARSETFDLLVLDCNMPGAHALDVLTRLRIDNTARSIASPAVASSAELDVSQQRSLLASGFNGVLLKPCTLADLEKILKLASSVHRATPLLDDRHALISTGNPKIMQALRGLLRKELDGFNRDLDRLSEDPPSFEARLHKLRSSCGFCGATALAEHILALQRHLKLEHRGALVPIADFRQSLLDTIDALDRT
jgi:CheY-like chemotaxis protein